MKGSPVRCRSQLARLGDIRVYVAGGGENWTGVRRRDLRHARGLVRLEILRKGCKFGERDAERCADATHAAPGRIARSRLQVRDPGWMHRRPVRNLFLCEVACAPDLAQRESESDLWVWGLRHR